VSWYSVDPDDRPTFESEAVYLERHGLWASPAEREAGRHLLTQTVTAIHGAVVVWPAD
jgi:hypothetical protein